ncbi:hypothetical protein ES332_A05G239300v1 [Gossypium tomentosum]|uniref:BHLH domain-containing protein n=1 Tax=Gossypium tomentosum TaxID=34277 RepID=A0A5D2QJS9_GOSTO|nr:hypothetical protein ES332_A05G239300v1 [Gossypium tomentosum]
MVCQAATQTRFRALKYENGIAGSATIVVRVIACFQPLQDCQAEYFRHLLKPVTETASRLPFSLLQHKLLVCGYISATWCYEYLLIILWNTFFKFYGCGSWFPQQQFHWQSPNLNSLAAPNPLGLQSTNPRFMNLGTDMVSVTGTSQFYANPELSHFGVSQRNEPRGWFYCLPCFRQVFAPASNSLLKEQHLADRYENLKESGTSKAGTGAAEKRFLVFDQSGDQTTLIFSSAIGTPTKCLSSWGPKSPAAGNFNGDVPMAKATRNLHSGPISTDVSYHKGTDVQSEMHEDTEELNALLYSDDDSEYSEDEEVTSTGHSPSTMTAQDEQFEGGSEEVDSSTRLIKKRKLLDGSYGCLPLLMDTANLGNFNRYSEYEDDADSSCAKGQNPGSGDTDSSSSNKRMRKDKIRESVTVLRSIIPGGEGKDAVAVLDEAINYLKSLKLKAKTLGLNTL